MRIKSKPQDFRVFELLHDGYVGDKGRFRIYRVTKKKLTSLEAASELALATGVRTSEIGMAGMKDRQGVTTQFMSVRGGRPIRFQTPSLKVETVGFAVHGLSSRDSMGNGFEIALRGVDPSEREEIEREAVSVREHGVPNYFGEQRFGNLRHGQGWVAKELALGRPESALRNLLAAPSESDNPHMRSFKRGLNSAWGDWKRCRDVAGAYGAHHSIFEHLAKDPEDFAGAFRYVKTEVRLIHLYAFQSHLWNRAIARFIGETTSPRDRVVVPSLEGPLAFARGPLAVPAAWNGNFRMPGEGLEDVEHEDQRRWLTAALDAEGMAPEDFRIHGVDGFGLKGEDRALVVHPRQLEIFPDRRSEGVLHVSFELPRGSYATLVLARLAPTREAETPDDAARRLRRESEQGEGQGDDGSRPYGERQEYGERQHGWRDERPSHDRSREERPSRGGERFDGRGSAGYRDERTRYDAPRYDAPRNEGPRYERPRYEQRRDEAAPRFDAPRQDRSRQDRPRYDTPRYDTPRNEGPRHERPRYEERRDVAAPRFDAPRQDRPRQDRPRYDAPRYDAPRYDAPRNDAPRNEGPRHERPRHEQRRDEAAPHSDAPRQDRPRYDAPREDAGRDDRPREPRPDRPVHDRPRYDGGRRVDARRNDPTRPGGRRPDARPAPKRYSDLRSSERRYDAPPVEYKPNEGERFDHVRPDGQRRGRLDQNKPRYPGPRDARSADYPRTNPAFDRAPDQGSSRASDRESARNQPDSRSSEDRRPATDRPDWRPTGAQRPDPRGPGSGGDDRDDTR